MMADVLILIRSLTFARLRSVCAMDDGARHSDAGRRRPRRIPTHGIACYSSPWIGPHRAGRALAPARWLAEQAEVRLADDLVHQRRTGRVHRAERDVTQQPLQF